MKRLNELSKQAHESAVKSGFWSEELSPEHYIMLVITEIAEMVEADREDKRANILGFELAESCGEAFNNSFERFIKNTVEDEMADVAIRLLDLAGSKGVECYLNPFEKYGVNNNFDRFTFTEKCYGLIEILVDDVYIDKTIQRALHYLDEISRNLNIDLDKHIDIKMKYNETREFKHGKKY